MVPGGTFFPRPHYLKGKKRQMCTDTIYYQLDHLQQYLIALIIREKTSMVALLNYDESHWWLVSKFQFDASLANGA
jgi:hypothetical protein